MACAAIKAMSSGVGMVSTLLLKDSLVHTAYKIFEADGMSDWFGFEGASNLML